jgi:hypothetical protein
MELDDLKNIWNQNKTIYPQKNEAEIAEMLKGRSTSIINKLKKSVGLELIFTIVAGIALLVYALTLPAGALKWIAIFFLVMLVGYSFYYVKKIILLNRFDTADQNLNRNLTQLIEKLSSYLNFYKRSYTVLYPLYFFLGLLFSGIERGTEDFFDSLMKPKSMMLVVAIGGIFYFASTWLVDWFLKKLYGNHLDKLKALLKELNEGPH